MFSHRFIAVCLLVLYGVPSLIGPHWHHHEISCHDCSHIAATSSSPEVDSECSTSSSAAKFCCSGHTHADSTATVDVQLVEHSENKSAAPSWIVLEVHDPCAICAFYAQAQSPVVGNVTAEAGVLIAASSAPEYLFLSRFHSDSQARGPPC